MLFPTSVVGSLPRPLFVLDLINGRPPLAREEYEQLMQAAVRYAVALQEHAGLDVLTDGDGGASPILASLPNWPTASN
jgi:methionine synthase II (cobalamin-independent)